MADVLTEVLDAVPKQQKSVVRKKEDEGKKEEEQKYTAEDYFALPENSHIELINGRFYKKFQDFEDMATPSFQHQEIVGVVYAEILAYIRAHKFPCKVVIAPFTVKLNPEDQSYVEPDISVICDKNKLREWGCEGAPDWVIEVSSPSNASQDYVRKMNLYQNAGVPEYWVINPASKDIGGYLLQDGIYQSTLYSFEEDVKASLYEDLYINISKLGVEY